MANKQFYNIQKKIINKILDKDIEYLINSTIFMEKLLKYAFDIKNPEQGTKLQEYIDIYVDDVILKGKLHSIRIDRNNVEHNVVDMLFDEYNAERDLDTLDSFLQYIIKQTNIEPFLYLLFIIEYKSLKKTFENQLNSIAQPQIVTNTFIENIISIQNKYYYYTSKYFPDVKVIKIHRHIANGEQCSPIFAVVHNLLIRSDIITISNYLRKQNILKNELNEIYFYQILILTAIRYGYFRNYTDNKIRLPLKDAQLFKIAYENIFNYVKMLNNMLLEQEEIIYNYNLSDSNDGKVYFNGSIFEYEKVDFDYSIKYNNPIWYSDKLNYKIDLSCVNIYEPLLEEIFGFKKFRTGQLEVIKNILEESSKVVPLAIFPTGYGKSLIYQFCALLQPLKTIVIVPTYILAYDQVVNLKEANYKLASILSNDLIEQKKLYNDIIVYATPELFLDDDHMHILNVDDHNKEIFNIVLDECHNISLWGHQFQPTYFALSKAILTNTKNTKITMFTATASTNVINDLRNQFSNKIISPIMPVKLDRGQIHYDVLKAKSVEEMAEKIKHQFRTNINSNNNWNCSNSADEPSLTLIINNDKDVLSHLYSVLSKDDKIGSYVELYDGTISTYEMFRYGLKTILLSNDDFVVGINVPNLVNIVCIGIPPSKEWLYQESGRVGRVGQKSNMQIYVQSSKSKALEMMLNRKYFIDEIIPMIETNKEYIDISNVYYIIEYFKNIEYISKLFKKMDKYINENIYVVGQERIGKTILNLSDDIKKDYDFLIYMLFLIEYVVIWLMKKPNKEIETKYVLTTKVDYKIDAFISTAIQKINKYTKDDQILKQFKTKLDECVTLDDILKIMITWYYETILSIKRQMLINTYQLVEDFNGDSIEMEKNLASYFNAHAIIDEIKKTNLQFLEFKNQDYSLEEISPINIILCSNCGAQVLESGKFCFDCGYSLLDNHNYTSDKASLEEMAIVSTNANQLIDDILDQLTLNNDSCLFNEQEDDYNAKKSSNNSSAEPISDITENVNILENNDNILAENMDEVEIIDIQTPIIELEEETLSDSELLLIKFKDAKTIDLFDFGLINKYREIDEENIIELKFSAERLIEGEYSFGLEVLLSLSELESSKSKLIRFYQLVNNSNKDFALKILKSQKYYINRKMKRKAKKIILNIYPPKNIFEYIMGIFKR